MINRGKLLSRPTMRYLRLMTDKPTIDQALAWLASAKGFKLGSGIVGKTGQVVLGLLILWGILVVKMTDNLYFDGVLAGIGCLITLFVVWFIIKTHSFAQENPAQALLEGAEVLAYKQLENEMATANLNQNSMKVVSGSNQDMLPNVGDSNAE